MAESEKLNRRQLLTVLLGSQFAHSVGCDMSKLPPVGELEHTSFDIGHLLRDGVKKAIRPDVHEDVGVTIVGGGIAGLAAAWRFKRAGFNDFVLAELERQPGGTARSGSRDGFKFPWGAHYIPVPMAENHALIELLSEMQVIQALTKGGQPQVSEEFLCREPEERVFSEGRWYEGLYPGHGASQEDLRQLAAFREEIDRWAEMRDASGRRMFAIPMATGSNDESVRKLDKLSMEQWLDERGWDSPRLRWLVDYSCRDDYGLSPDRVSAWAGVFYFAARIAGMGNESQEVITWPEGNGRVVDYLRGVGDDKIRTGLAVFRVKAGTNTESSQVAAFDTNTMKPIGFRSQQVVFAAPQMMAKYVIDGFSASGRDSTAFRYGSWLVANVHIKDRPEDSGFPMAWDNVIRESRSLGYVTATHQTGVDYGPTVLTWYYPFADVDAAITRKQMMNLKWADWADVVLSDLRRAHPDIDTLVTRVDVMCWGHAMIQPLPGFVWSPEREQASKPLGPIHFAGTDLSGVALLEEAFFHGVRAAEEILAVRGILDQPLVEIRND
ncbi:MAG: twin-arginine translocation pathway signal [Rhodopirellula sp.]|nr:twin-arginine translocation pathway signal [Rhodopirellula sp.]